MQQRSCEQARDFDSSDMRRSRGGTVTGSHERLTGQCPCESARKGTVGELFDSGGRERETGALGPCGVGGGGGVGSAPCDATSDDGRRPISKGGCGACAVRISRVDIAAGPALTRRFLAFLDFLPSRCSPRFVHFARSAHYLYIAPAPAHALSRPLSAFSVMLKPRDALIWGLCALPGACRAAPQSGAGTGTPASGVESREGHSGRRLQGRFLHITGGCAPELDALVRRLGGNATLTVRADFHPDPFYKTYAATSSDAACHRKRGPAGVYGAETSGCDSPYSLVNETFKWIDEHIKDKVDFVVWTGDSARHDNDEKIPRTQKQIIKQNEFVVSKFAQVFGNQGSGHDSTSDYIVPNVPTFGNNDIMPHNIFLAGPNKWTMKYLDIWRDFIPEAQRHQFQQGGWFYKEVIPGKLAVISLNTMWVAIPATWGCHRR